MKTSKQLTEKTVVAAMKIASQFGTPESLDQNVETIKTVIDKAAAQNAKIVVMPETAITGYASQDLSTIWQVPGYPDCQGFKGLDPAPYALEVDVPTKPLPSHLQAFADQATDRGIYIVATFLEKEYQQNEYLRKKYGDYVFYSSSALFKPKEGMVGHYRKNDLWMAVDKASMTAGNKLVTYDTEYGRISIAVCFDVMALLPLIKKHNVWAHFHSFAWVDEKDGQPVTFKRLHTTNKKTQKAKMGDQWTGNWLRAGLPGKLFDNAGGFYFVAANWSVDNQQNWTGFGYESIYTPEGIILSQDSSPLGNGFTLAELDPPEEIIPPPYPLYE